MNEIYWITRCDDISCFLTTMSVVFGTVSGIALIIMCIVIGEEEYDIIKACIKFTKFALPAFLLSMLINVFVPTTKDAMLIFGVGSTIDYIKSNETIQEIPDKCINALDAWVESLNKEDKIE